MMFWVLVGVVLGGVIGTVIMLARPRPDRHAGEAIPFDVDVERRRLNRLVHAAQQQRQASIDGLEAALNAFDRARTSGLIDEHARGDREGTGQR